MSILSYFKVGCVKWKSWSYSSKQWYTVVKFTLYSAVASQLLMCIHSNAKNVFTWCTFPCCEDNAYNSDLPLWKALFSFFGKHHTQFSMVPLERHPALWPRDTGPLEALGPRHCTGPAATTTRPNTVGICPLGPWIGILEYCSLQDLLSLPYRVQ
jgi:hypothetical protein